LGWGSQGGGMNQTFLAMDIQSTLCKAAKTVKAHLGDVHSFLAMDARALYAKQGSQVE